MEDGAMIAFFELECPHTAPEEAILLVGGDGVIGNWDLHGAVMMETSAQRFPWWVTSGPLVFDSEVEFQFAISDRSSQNVRWESLPFKRRLAKVPRHKDGRVLEVVFRASWDDAKSTVSVRPSKIARAHELQEAALESAEADVLRERSRSREREPVPLPGMPVPRRGPGVTEPEAMARSTRRALDPARAFLKKWMGSCKALAESPALTGGVSLTEATLRTSRRHTARLPSEPRAGDPARAFLKMSICTAPAQLALIGVLPTEAATLDPARAFLKTMSICTALAAQPALTGGVWPTEATLFALRGRKTMTVVPMYTRPPPEEGFKYIGSAWVRLDKSDQEVRCMHKYVSYGDGKGCDHVLLDHGCYQHRPHGLYCDSRTGQDYGDNLYRFAMLSLAALEVALRINFGGLPFGQRVMFLSHDWQAGLLPVYLAHQYRRAGVYREARTLHVIHNLGYQGKFPASRAAVHTLLGLEESAGQDLHQDADLNICKAAVLCADRVVTVSPSYAREIQTPQGGCGLEEVLSQKQRMLRLAGIRNALDDDWDPSSDKHIVRRYNQESFLAGRKECKAALQKKLGLSVSPRAVLFGFVGRLTWQKGVDVLVRVAPWLLTAGLAPQAAPSTGPRAQIVIMGEGEQQYKHLVQDLEMRNRRAVCGLTGFDPVLEHQMMAGCDFILMPSRYEPCGLPQMAACTYGALPIATCTGGLKDSVRGVQQERPTGFLIQPPLSESSLRQALRDAMMLYFQSPARFQQMQRNAMAQDFRWGPAIDEYEHQMRLALVSPPQR
ncbi:unnamed protein product [Effrenium voratum]|nr:unnamed protein product [Effrenium voratum]